LQLQGSGYMYRRRTSLPLQDTPVLILKLVYHSSMMVQRDMVLLVSGNFQGA